MSKSKHTPGPWWFKRIDTPTDKFSQSGERICERRMVIGDKEDWVLADMDLTEANARLIAAAPELLARLEEFRKMFAFSPDGQIIQRPHNMHDWLLSVDQTIDKAKGENHE